MKLQSMTDFVLEQYDHFREDGAPQRIQIIANYAKFLKTPLELWMFVPCDENGNVLEEPRFEDCEKYDNPVRTYEGRVRAYQKAKDRVLFEGGSVGGVGRIVLKNPSPVFHNEKTIGNIRINPVYRFARHTVESMLNYGFPITLTESAKNQIL